MVKMFNPFATFNRRAARLCSKRFERLERLERSEATPGLFTTPGSLLAQTGLRVQLWNPG
jgi:hypothetical protein